ncbi:hypothetical protein JIN84_15470 [Luteolibacter yonseiensis]|uniref:Ferritin-like domain-containing protein n=1 Tax=Luteolibacter yonseiensis TaxID=1144680 RepID=A0A934R263_9BACT|nr:hypothetical protein [Luteolibacter yonseiensis]MBK1817023.1 hypothetical protein [Luteolibacter yonseiensis]
MDQQLERYLNDHLAGSSGAILMIQNFAETVEHPEARDFFIKLKQDVENDRELLKRLLETAGMRSSTVLNVAGDLTARVGFLKLMWEGFEPGKLGLFEGLEMLALGVQGKRLLWLALQEISAWYPEWSDVDFRELELEAIKQRDGVEFWRIEAARDALPDIDRRTRALEKVG